jgi:hypothetical protein
MNRVAAFGKRLAPLFGRLTGIGERVGLERPKAHLVFRAAEGVAQQPAVIELPGLRPAGRYLKEQAAVRMQPRLGVSDLCGREALDLPCPRRLRYKLLYLRQSMLDWRRLEGKRGRIDFSSASYSGP